MPRELVLVAVAAGLLGATAVAVGRPSEQSALPRWLSQAVLGVLCGGAVALLVIAPYVDLVPDRSEGPVGTVVVALTLALAAVAALRWRARHRGGADELADTPPRPPPAIGARRPTGPTSDRGGGGSLAPP